ncbi:uncharacterized protein LOC103312852 [Tribolium castaneum]|uniref:Uncharacterized protein n=1 Tax=Tribolium castaneum TaxID=7070 RepID=D2A1N5_TRICA|nr:PREDICTED: uncharacterized protein LOC103312852 [Tribolium castaneum]XP_015835034.1 PREDICTED: uncharacterized protein LOC103312852 [Tribolium castaneum]EFA01519.1 hypothetical protein TcasGA2_TC007078 [Tribolium castaneum]|eukprot:XP_015835033.1 PREDICTED: uncharacterized protein LOC103312852 [Tribolium castaneum]
MNRVTIFLLLLVIAACQSFFLQSKDIKRMLRYFPKAFDIETTRSRPLRTRNREPEPIHHDYIDSYDRQDNGEPSKYTKSTKGRNRKPNYHHCDHPDHYHHHHHPEDRVQTQRNNKNTKYEDSEDYDTDKKKYKKKMILNEEKENADDQKDKKDYITGVLVTIPKIKGSGDAESYLKSGKHNVFFQQPLKTEDEDYHHYHRHHIPGDEDFDSYFY